MNHRMSNVLLSAMQQRDTIKALTMTDPWGTLIALEAKRIETRSWRTDYRGPLAIHIARKLPEDLDDLCAQPHFREALPESFLNPYVPQAKRFPVGKMLAIVMLDEVVPTELAHPTEQERAFGNYAPGRYAWKFSTVYRLQTPIPVRGCLGLWTWTPPSFFWEEVTTAKESISCNS